MTEPYWEPLSGAPGPAGPAGAAGAAGATGPTGPQGPSGGLTDAASYALKAGHILTGGGTITFSASGRLKWTNRFISISRGLSYQSMNMPAVGVVITGVGGVANDTVTSEGILLNSWHSLYYVPSTDTYRIVYYVANLVPAYIPLDWILIAQHNADQGIMWVTPGIPLRPGESTGSDPVVTGPSVAAVAPTRRGKLIGIYSGDGLGSYDIPLMHWNDVLGKYVSNAWSINLCKHEKVIGMGGGAPYGPYEVPAGGDGAARTPPCWIPSAAYHNMGLQLQLKYIICGWMQFSGGTTTQTWRGWINYQNNGGGSWGSADIGDGITGVSTAELVQGGPWIAVPTGYTAYSFVAPSFGYYGVGTGNFQGLIRSASVQCRWVSQ